MDTKSPVAVKDTSLEGLCELSGTLRNIILKQRGACLQTISLMRIKLLPSPPTLFPSPAQCRQKVPDPESAFVRSVADREHAESLHWLPDADSWASEDLNPVV